MQASSEHVRVVIVKAFGAGIVMTRILRCSVGPYRFRIFLS
jgi:hypothetical protein